MGLSSHLLLNWQHSRAEQSTAAALHLNQLQAMLSQPDLYAGGPSIKCVLYQLLDCGR
jgi:hypothetical protein